MADRMMSNVRSGGICGSAEKPGAVTLPETQHHEDDEPYESAALHAREFGFEFTAIHGTIAPFAKPIVSPRICCER
jgi:hypothetical protein